MRTTTSRDFADWRRFRAIEPSGPPVTAWQVALCTAAIVQALGGADARPEDFLVEPFAAARRAAIEEGEIDEEHEEDGEETPADLDGSDRSARRGAWGVDLDS